VFEALVNAFRAPDIRRRILFILGMLVVVRALANVPLPGVDRDALAGVIGQNEFLQLLNLFSGGGLENFSIIALGVNPYINASIIMQLMTGVVPKLQQLQREGEYGRNKINQYTRYLTVPMALLQSYGYLAILSTQTGSNGQAVIPAFDLASFETLTMIATLTAGSVLLMWIGELITERGIGNGMSLLIFTSIAAGFSNMITNLRSKEGSRDSRCSAFGEVMITASNSSPTAAISSGPVLKIRSTRPQLFTATSMATGLGSARAYNSHSLPNPSCNKPR